MLEARIRKRLGAGRNAFTVDVDLWAPEGITVLFGPSGAGKTSILRAVAGILDPDEGRIALAGSVFFDSAAGIRIPARRRNVGYVFQHHLLFPHLTAAQNALYAARADTPRSARERVRELFRLLDIEQAAERLPHQLSGGEQQRVALARALVTDPSIMLLDEPLTAVDASTRARLIDEIARLQERTRIPFLYVTHDHAEALRLGTALIVLDQGSVAQRGTPLDVLSAPRAASVARIVGTENVLAGRVRAHQPEEGLTAVEVGPLVIQTSLNSLTIGSRVTIGIRSEDILVSREHLTQTSARNVLAGTVRVLHQDLDKADLVVDCGVDLNVGVTPAAVRIMSLSVGTPVFLLFKARAVHILV